MFGHAALYDSSLTVTIIASATLHALRTSSLTTLWHALPVDTTWPSSSRGGIIDWQELEYHPILSYPADPTSSKDGIATS